MTEDALLKFAQPFLIGLGLLVVLNFWNIIQSIWSARKKKDSKIEQDIEKITEKIIRMDERLGQLERNLNNIGRLVRELKK